jgi:hypothetical protein
MSTDSNEGKTSFMSQPQQNEATKQVSDERSKM